MKKLIPIILILLFSIQIYAQEHTFDAPDYAKIEKKATKKRSKLGYKKLFKRYNQGDTTLTLKEMRYLYFGYSYQKGYSAYFSSNYHDSLTPYYSKAELNIQDYEAIINYSEKALEDFPFDMRALSALSYAAEKTQDTDLVDLCVFKTSVIVDAILSTGNGLTDETAIHVIKISHEYDILDILGLEFGGNQSLVEGPCDYLTVKQGSAKVEGLYFNITRPMNSLSNMFE